jgi:hypothetical protein
MLLLVLWGVVLGPALVAVVPPPVAARLPAAADRPTVPRPTPLLLVAIAVGAITHVVWDAFTHAGRWGTVLLPVLQQRVGPVLLASWLQYASSVLGVLLLAGWAVAMLARTAAAQDRFPVLSAPARRVAAAVLVVACLIGAVAGAVAQRGSGAPAAAFAAATSAIDAAGAVLIVLGVLLGTRSRRS